MATANKVWIQNLKALIDHGRPISPRGQDTVECIPYMSQIDMDFPVVSVRERCLSYRFMTAEAYWILTGSNLVEPLARHAPSIRQFSDDGATFFGAYGPQVMPQIDYVTSTLIKDLHSRQAVATIWKRCPPKTKDVPCTVALQWLVRDGTLHCIDTMRSSDIWLGWPYDVFSFTMLTAFVALRLRARGILLKMGQLFLVAGSQHLYARNFKAAESCINNCEAIDYRPFNIELFSTDRDLLTFLDDASNNGRDHIWMTELFRAESDQ